ncbi:MAG TPA: helix-turn-helix domain-containing protein [Actinomycetota bacterium]|nr:helix-turn-helix domain-containing protein [Actinomycetota bacterium]
MQRSSIGLGPALRKARERRGVSLAEASRDTRIRAEFLEAIEAEEFDRLLGDVHVRGCLRSYATYLGVPADRVLTVYGGDAEEAVAAPPPPKPPTETDLTLPRRRDNARLVVMIAATVLILASAFGILSARDPAPPPADLSEPSVAVEQPPPPGITLTVLAREPVEVTITIDGGEPRPYDLEPGEGRSFEADTTLDVRLSSGSTVQVTVAGKDLGFPGKEGKPWHQTFTYEADPSPAG